MGSNRGVRLAALALLAVFCFVSMAAAADAQWRRRGSRQGPPDIAGPGMQAPWESPPPHFGPPPGPFGPPPMCCPPQGPGGMPPAPHKPWMNPKVVSVVVEHAPGIVRHGAELYCLRLEMLRCFYTKDQTDGETDGLIKKAQGALEAVGSGVVALVADLKAKLPGTNLHKLLQASYAKRAQARAKGQGAPAAGAWAMAKRFQNGFEVMGDALGLGMGQRVKMKLQVLTSVPAVVRAGAAAAGDGMRFMKGLMEPELNTKDCEKAAAGFAANAADAVKAAVGLAFGLKSQLTPEQKETLLATVPLRMLMFR